MQDFVLSELHAVIVITSVSPKNCIIGNVFFNVFDMFFLPYTTCGGRHVNLLFTRLWPHRAVSHVADGFAKDGLLSCERPSFTRSKATFCTTKGRLSQNRLPQGFSAPAGTARLKAWHVLCRKSFLSIIHTIIVLKYVTSAIFFSNFAKAVRPFPVTI